MARVIFPVNWRIILKIEYDPYTRQTLSSTNSGQNRALVSFIEEPDFSGKLLLPSELEDRIRQFVAYYNYERYHESLNNLTPADVFYGRGQSILDEREKIKRRTLALRRQIFYAKQLTNSDLMS